MQSINLSITWVLLGLLGLILMSVHNGVLGALGVICSLITLSALALYWHKPQEKRPS